MPDLSAAAALSLLVGMATEMPIAQPGIPALQQIDFPVLATGDTATFRVRIAAHQGGRGTVAHAAFALMPGADEDRGYRFFAVDCPAGFIANVHDEDRGVVCHRHDAAAYAEAEMAVHVRNTGAADGLTWMRGGLRSLVADVGTVDADWFLYGVEGQDGQIPGGEAADGP